MGVLLFSDLGPFRPVRFDPTRDKLLFDLRTDDVKDLVFDTSGPDLGITLNGKTVRFKGLSLEELSSASVQFRTKDLLVIGDETPDSLADRFGQIVDLSGVEADVRIEGIGGADILTTGGGDDMLVGGTVPAQGRQHVSKAGGVGAPTGTTNPSISADGRFIGFDGGWSGFGSNGNNAQDVIVADMQTGTFSNEHLKFDGSFPGSGSGGAAISADGATLVFHSFSALLPSSGLFETVYATDTDSLDIEAVSVTASGQFGNGASFNADLSGDGRFVVFGSRAANFAANGESLVTDIFLKDRQTEALIRVSTSLGDGDADADCSQARISADGRYVVFTSAATNLSAVHSSSGNTDIYLYDRSTDLRINLTGDARGSGSSSGGDVAGGNGGVVVFDTARALLAGDTNNAIDVYAYDIATGVFERISVRGNGSQVSGGGQDAAVSGDGRYVVFRSFATDLVPNDTNGFADIFVKDRLTGSVALVSGAGGGAGGNQQVGGDAEISLGGEWIVFSSGASNLAATDGNGGISDVFRVANPLFRSVLTGGDGDDIYVLTRPQDEVVELKGGGTDSVRVDGSYRLEDNLENLRLLGTGNWSGVGNRLDNVIIGNAGDNRIDGAGGNDTASYVNATGSVWLDLRVERQFNTFGYLFGRDALIAIENLTGSAFDDRLWGNAGDNILDGGAGEDVLFGGAGSDIYHVDNRRDFATEEDRFSTSDIDRVYSSVDFTLTAFVEALTLVDGSTAIICFGNAEHNVLTGNGRNNDVSGFDGNDMLYGLTGLDRLTGGNGNDLLDGGTGDDQMFGGEGSDTFIVDSLQDVISDVGAGTTDIDLVRASVNWTLGNGFESLTLEGNAPLSGTGNAGANVITGNTGSNTLRGLAGVDVINGGSGGDTLIGDAGSDRLTGSFGADTFVLTSLSGSDTVTDFASGQDRIRVAQSTLRVGDGDLLVEGGAVRAAAGGFATSAELVIFTANLGALTAAAAAAGIGSAAAAYAAGAQALFAVDNGTSAALFRFTSAGADAGVSAAELTLLSTLQGTATTALGDYLFSA